MAQLQVWTVLFDIKYKLTYYRRFKVICVVESLKSLESRNVSEGLRSCLGLKCEQTPESLSSPAQDWTEVQTNEKSNFCWRTSSKARLESAEKKLQERHRLKKIIWSEETEPQTLWFVQMLSKVGEKKERNIARRTPPSQWSRRTKHVSRSRISLIRSSWSDKIHMVKKRTLKQ